MRGREHDAAAVVGRGREAVGGTSVTSYVPAARLSSFWPSGVNGVDSPPLTLKEKLLGGWFEPTTTFFTRSFNGVTVCAVFVIVHTGTVAGGPTA